ncbi:hypothetical protein G6L91_11480 [Agrobacterium rhizogenes]|uniref:hypothetical protein n=1 Tax=Rhizobium rhizogenes TaxID=359 RepID=UPI0015730E72|nr:hypothetical protein [Rhizobium rhizogenes]NTF62088.1 hypothetical protein [Rhizobium rhizogenes]
MPSRVPTSGPGTRIFGANRRQVVMRHTSGSTTWMDDIDAERVLAEHPSEWSLNNADADASMVDGYTPKVRVS